VRRSERNLQRFAETQRNLQAGEPFPLERSNEFGAPIVHSLLTGEPRVVHGNVENTGLIPNLPWGCCVEVPIVADRAGLRPCHVAPLAPQLVANIVPHVMVQELVVRAALEGRRDHVYHAAMLDRQTSSVLSLDEIHALVDDLIAAHGAALPAGIRDA
jgi:alpha-galactosidase